jgi:hypothetical protein
MTRHIVVAELCRRKAERIDSKINYRTKFNYRVRARLGRPEDEVERR